MLCAIFRFFFGKTTLYGKIFKMLFRKFTSRHRLTLCSNVVKFVWREMLKSCVIYVTKKTTFAAASQTVATARITLKICQDQPPTFGSHCSRFHPNRFTFGGVIAERVNTVLLPRKVFPWFARSEASLRAIVNECPSCRQSGVNSGVSPVVKSGVDCWQ